MPFDVALTPATEVDAPMLARLLQLYAYDFSEIMQLDVGEDGCFTGGTPLASCWSEPWRHAYVIRAGEHVAGFCILDERSRLTGATTTCDVAEFFVMRRYRRNGVGVRAAHLAFELFRRPWEVRQTRTNAAATSFWRHAIGLYTNGAFTETVVDDERWRGPVQSFG